MNSSANLISLSDSGLAPNSPFPSSAGGTTSNGRNDRSLLINSSGNKSGLLIDLTDEVQVPASQAIMTLAEIDDTYGIFNKAPPSHPRVKQVIENDEATKLVRSFTSGRKSNGNVADSGLEAEQQKDNESSEEQTTVDENKNDSGGAGSISESEQPTIVESTHQECKSSQTPRRDEEGILEQMKVAALSCNSGGSDSDILDISNLSSFSIPEADFDDDEFLENIKLDVPGSSTLLDEIRFQLMQEQNESKGPNLLSNICRPSNVSNGTSRVSTSSNVRFSSPPPRVPNSNRISTASTISSIGDDDDGAPFARARCRLSGMLSSPIRASYPVSKYYMPTPKAATPNPKGTARDKFSQSFCSPNMTRVVVTGDARRSPSRVPVRKSISAETLHFETSPARNRNTTLTLLKFSTPSAPSSRSRQSMGFQTTFTNEQEMNAEETANRNNLRNTFNNKGDNYALESDVFRVPRYGRLSSASRASSASTNSINTLSPTGSSTSTSSYSKKDISDVVRQMKQMRMNDTSSSRNSIINRTTTLTASNAYSSTATVQPMRATAVIPPSSNVSISETSEPSTKPNYGSTVVSSTGQRKFIPPVAQSSPKTTASPARPINQTTPSRTRYNGNIKSSGYGMGAQNLNSTFGSKPPLQSPNPKIPASVTTMKPPAVPKSLGTRLQFAAKTEVPRLGLKTVKLAMPPPKMPTTGLLRRPASGISTVNKENNTRTIGLKTGLSRPRQ